MDIMIINSYDVARKQGLSRPDALLRAVRVYRDRHPEMEPEEAGRDVVRMLLQAARTQE
jgi:hypothetical protein